MVKNRYILFILLFAFEGVCSNGAFSKKDASLCGSGLLAHKVLKLIPHQEIKVQHGYFRAALQGNLFNKSRPFLHLLIRLQIKNELMDSDKKLLCIQNEQAFLQSCVTKLIAEQRKIDSLLSNLSSAKYSLFGKFRNFFKGAVALIFCGWLAATLNQQSKRINNLSEGFSERIEQALDELAQNNEELIRFRQELSTQIECLKMLHKVPTTVQMTVPQEVSNNLQEIISKIENQEALIKKLQSSLLELNNAVMTNCAPSSR